MYICEWWKCINLISVSILRPRHNSSHFATDIYRCICLDENGCILKFQWKLPRLQLTVRQHWFRYGLASREMYDAHDINLAFVVILSNWNRLQHKYQRSNSDNIKRDKIEKWCVNLCLRNRNFSRWRHKFLFVMSYGIRIWFQYTE